MLDSDERGAAESAAEMFRDAAVPQFWDGSQHLGKAVAHALDQAGWVAWDIYLFYEPDAEWSARGLPSSRAVLVQVALDGRGGIIATRGVLPPRGDQARLPARWQGHVDIVGAREDLAALLTALVVR